MSFMAGIQVARTLTETSMSAWIPALNAGMTRLGASASDERNCFSDIFEDVTNTRACVVLKIRLKLKTRLEQFL